MQTIWKYELIITDIQEIEIPKNSHILTVQTQRGMPCIWAIIDSEAEKSKLKIYTFGTGNPIPRNFNGEYIGTYLVKNDELVFHVFSKRQEG